MSSQLDQELRRHLLQTSGQEDICFALWYPSRGRSRFSALLHRVVLPRDGDRLLHGNATLSTQFFDRVLREAIGAGAGIALLHSHLGPGWQGMSEDDVATELRLAPPAFGATGLPLVGLTLGTDGAWSARFWERFAPRQFDRKWCATVRVIGTEFRMTYMERLAPAPKFREQLKRTISSWGSMKQAQLARLRVGVIGAGSVGAIVAEALARMGIEDVLLVDFDEVKTHNLDRLIHATQSDADNKRLKVDVVAEHLRAHATADSFNVEGLPLSVCDESGYRAALDCDVLLSCVDRPWGRSVLNFIAYAHLIPVIDGGISVRQTSRGTLRGADWRAHVAAPSRRCLECLEQYAPGDVTLERDGFLDDPTYIEGLPPGDALRRNENVFAFSVNAAGLQVLQLLSLVLAPGGVSDPGGQVFHFVTGTLDKEHHAGCKETCPYPEFVARGDASGIVVTGPRPPSRNATPTVTGGDRR